MPILRVGLLVVLLTTSSLGCLPTHGGTITISGQAVPAKTVAFNINTFLATGLSLARTRSTTSRFSSVVCRRSRHRRATRTRISSYTSSSSLGLLAHSTMSDPFGNDDGIDWDAFDPDAAVAAATAAADGRNSTTNTNGIGNSNQGHQQRQQVPQPSSKRPKIVAAAAAAAAPANPYSAFGGSQQQRQYHSTNTASPFGTTSRFSVGTRADVDDYPNNFFGAPDAGSTSTRSISNVAAATDAAAAVDSNSNGSNIMKQAVSSSHQRNGHTGTGSQNHTKLEHELRSTLQTYFGHSDYRPGQLDAITALLGCSGTSSTSTGSRSTAPLSSPRDVAVFWATGSGKSMVYQIPPLHTGKIAVVVSPLISLMEDQVGKLNGLLGGDDSGGGGSGSNGTSRPSSTSTDVAVFLGSGQMDPMAEERALNGEYKLVYLTPEKLLSGNFLDRLGRLHGAGGNFGGNGNICLIAVDESHCCSEWGHDFRPEYRRIGQSIRSHPVLSAIPMLALTATAVSRVQSDILQTLRMSDNVKVVKQSFDRPNLQINVRRKPPSGGSYRAALKPLVDEMVAATSSASKPSVGGAGQSTIIYCPTRDSVEEVAQHLSQQFQVTGSTIRAEPYHAGMTPQSRTSAHTNFLVGRTQIIVATVAFGMGIDKPDTRRVLHWGAPKTVEEYYQQIGRAGRDGLPATAIMYANDADFTRYKSDFYLGNLSAEAKAATERSIDALRSFAMDGETCRRAALLRFFDEIPKFGDRCGTCDCCRDRAQHGDDIERDFAAAGARLVLRAANALSEPSIGTIEKVLKGDVVDHWRYCYGVNGQAVSKTVTSEREALPKRKPLSFFKELVPALVSRGYLDRGTKSTQAGTSSYRNSWTTYSITSKGKMACNDTSAAIILPVPASVRDIERIEEEKRQETLNQLKDAGYDLEHIPKNEVEQGDGEVIRTLKQWHNYINGLKKRENFDRVNQLDDLRSRIVTWRADTAEKYRMAPGAVMEEHLIIRIAYATASLPCGAEVDRDTLVAVGVRSRGLDDLVISLREWTKKTSKSEGARSPSSASMVLADEPYTPPSSWEFAVYKPNKKTGLATWESSYNRFMEGENPMTIAMNPANGKPIQVGTVVKHIQDGLLHGRPVPLKKLAAVVAPPNKEEWDTLSKCEDVTGFDVTKDPNTSGVDGGFFRMKDFLVPVMGNAFVSKDIKERTQEEKSKFNHWCNTLNWYMSLRRSKYTPTFDGADETIAYCRFQRYK